MELRHKLATGIAASAIVHLSALGLVLWFSEVHPFGQVTAEPIAVDLVSSAELKPPPDIKPAPDQPAPDQPEPPPDAKPETFAGPSPAASSPPPADTKPKSPPAAKPAVAVNSPQPSPQPRASRQPASVAPRPPAPYAPPGRIYPDPELGFKAQALLDQLAEPRADRAEGSASAELDAPATATDELAADLKAEFRRRLKPCAKLPTEVAFPDDVKVKIRIYLTPQGTLAAVPTRLGGNHPLDKGPALIESVEAALRACQPYTLPAERYGEWRLLELVFTPQNFVGG